MADSRRHKAMENVMEREEKMQFAVLIDAENVSARYVQVILTSWRNMDLLPAGGSTATGPKSLAGRKIFCWSIR